MTGCPAIGPDGPAGIADALRTVDCLAGQVTATGFGRLFGEGGGLLGGLTILLTLYVALLAVNLLTGRSTLGVSALTPRALGLGLALTFATSWIAYQSVFWNLLVAGPDWLAGLLVGTKGSATTLFANRLDGLFDAIAEAAQAVQAATSGDAAKAQGFGPADILWLSALTLLLGTVGVLVTAKVALAALLGLGPVFIVLALFAGTRGLFEGWLKAAVLCALVPLFAVLIGGATLALLGPAVRGLAMAGGEPPLRLVGTVLVGAAVHVALMVMALKMAATLTAGWRLPGARSERTGAAGGGTVTLPASAQASATMAGPTATPPAADRVRAMVAGMRVPSPATATLGETGSAARPRIVTGGPVLATLNGRPVVPGRIDTRAAGIGARFRQPTATTPKEMRR